MKTKHLALCAALAFACATSAFAQDTTTETPATETPAAETAAAPATEPAAAAEPAPEATAQDASVPAEAATPPAAEDGYVAAYSEIVGRPPAGQGQVVFFRPSRFTGAALSFSVREGDEGVGRLGNGRYFVHPTTPGVHEYNISGEVTDTLRLEIEEGETYYVQQTINMGIMMGRPVLTPSDQATFEERPLRVSTQEGVDRRRR